MIRIHRKAVRTVFAMCVAAAVALGITGCGTSATEGTTAKPVLTIATPQPPTSIDPSKGAGGSNTLFQDPAYQSLLHITGKATVSPSLASSFKWLDDSNTTFQITLHKNLRFSDGTALDAEAVKTSIEHFKAANGPFAYAAAPIASIDTPDERTVVFHLSKATPQFPQNLAEQTGMGAIISPAAIAKKSDLGTSTAGAGPYTLSSAGTVEGSIYTYTPNAKYYDQKAIKYSKVQVKVISNVNTALSSLRSGQVDVTYGDASTYASAKSAGLHTVAFPVGIFGLWLQDQNGKLTPALADVNVRRAIDYAINRRAIAKVITAGTGAATQQAVLPGTLGYDKRLDKAYPYNPGKAKELLAAAGYKDGFSMSITVAPGVSQSKLAQALVEQLSKVNITVSIIPASTFTEYATQGNSGKYQATVVGLGLSGMPLTMDNLFSPEALINSGHVKFPEVVAAATKAAKLQGTQAEDAWKAVNKLTVGNAITFPVTTTSAIYYWGDSVSGVDKSSAFNPVFFTPAS